jgi:hypothetical protein
MIRSVDILLVDVDNRVTKSNNVLSSDSFPPIQLVNSNKVFL